MLTEVHVRVTDMGKQMNSISKSINGIRTDVTDQGKKISALEERTKAHAWSLRALFSAMIGAFYWLFRK